MYQDFFSWHFGSMHLWVFRLKKLTLSLIKLFTSVDKAAINAVLLFQDY